MNELTLEEMKKRVDQFNTLSLPGQGMSMHMGTSYLVSDLWKKVKEQQKEIELLRAENKRLKSRENLSFDDYEPFTEER